MTPTEIREDLDDWSNVREDGVPQPVEQWHYDATSNRWIVDGVAFTKPQVEAFLLGLERGLGWVFKVAEHVHPGAVVEVGVEVLDR